MSQIPSTGHMHTDTHSHTHKHTHMHGTAAVCAVILLESVD